MKTYRTITRRICEEAIPEEMIYVYIKEDEELKIGILSNCSKRSSITCNDISPSPKIGKSSSSNATGRVDEITEPVILFELQSIRKI